MLSRNQHDHNKSKGDKITSRLRSTELWFYCQQSEVIFRVIIKFKFLLYTVLWLLIFFKNSVFSIFCLDATCSSNMNSIHRLPCRSQNSDAKNRKSYRPTRNRKARHLWQNSIVSSATYATRVYAKSSFSIRRFTSSGRVSICFRPQPQLVISTLLRDSFLMRVTST